jgi:hypothetical protein
MPGPLPILTNGRIQIQTVDTILGKHVSNLDVQITAPTGGTPFTLDVQTGAVILWTDAVDEFVAEMKKFYAATTTIDTAILGYFVSGAYQALESYAPGVAGTLVGSNVPALQQTLTLRDSHYHLDKIVFMECGGVLPLHATPTALGAPYSTLAASVTDLTAGKIGRWYLSKSRWPMQNALFFTDTFNKRLRRKRGQV